MNVFFTFPDGSTVLAGELVHGTMDSGGMIPSAFRYAPGWLRHHGAFPLDPESLPLRPGVFEASNLAPPLGVFDDALPDDWGRRLIFMHQKIPMREQTVFRLLRELGSDTMGALSFSDARKPPARKWVTHDIADLMAAAERIDAGETIEDSALHRLFEAGATPGGARPKAIVLIDEARWIVKFPSMHRDRGFDVPGLEVVCLDLARQAGIDVPEFRLLDINGRHCTAVRRFDLTAAGRIHMLSIRTLGCERGGRYLNSYGEVMALVRKHSAEQGDVEALFARMVFNAAIGNTDDHSKNFSMIRDEAGYRLSPAYDLVPNINGNAFHTLSMGNTPGTPSHSELLAIGKSWLGDVGAAGAIIDRVATAVGRFGDVCREYGIEDRSVDHFTRDIGKRVRAIAFP
jgi:serine/threonine-protein kinase HipA